MKLTDFLTEAAAETEQALEQALPQPEGPEAVLYEAMRYSVFAGGKRLRPALFLAVLAAFPARLEAAREAYLPFAAALEMIHTYSLIHDDLPAMDDDDLRRGRPTCHKVYGEATAILAGDALLTHAFTTMLQLNSVVTGQRLPQAVAEVAVAAGAQGMVAGQMVDILAEGQQLDLQQLQYIYARKTGALFAASVLSAAHLLGLKEAELDDLRCYCKHLGLAFQIADDILDQTADPQKLGKPLGSDAKNAKCTYASLLGVEQAQEQGLAAADRAAGALDGFGPELDLLRTFPYAFIERDR